MTSTMINPAIQEQEMLSNNQSEVYVRQFILALPGIAYIIYAFLNAYMTLIGAFLACGFVVVAHFPFTWGHWEKVRLFILCGFFYAFLYHLLPGFNHQLLYADLGISVNSETNLWLHVDLVLIVATFGLTFFVKDQRYKSIPVHHCAVQFIQILTPKYRSKIILNCWLMALTVFVGLFFYFNLGTFELKVPTEIWIHWFVVSLFITTLSQEFFIRGELQYYFTSHFGLLGVIIASVVGGLFYLPISPVLAFIMCAIGLCTGYAYYKTQLIVSSILIHISILITHFCFLTYPFNFGG